MKLKDRFKIYLRYQSFNQKAPEILERKIKEISQEVSFFSSIRLPIKKKRLTLLRSPHVNKKSRDQLEIRLYNGLIVLSTYSLSCGFLKALYECYFPEISIKISITSNFQNIKC